MSRLGRKLKDEMPIDRLKAYCGECEERFFDSATDAEKSALIAGDIIAVQAKAHRNTTGHDDLQVDIEKPVPVKEIDATITVGKT